MDEHGENFALALVQHWRGPDSTDAREFRAARPATLLRALCHSPIPARL